MTHVHCPECGFQNLEAAHYCEKCGALLIPDDGSDQTLTFESGEDAEEAVTSFLGEAGAERTLRTAQDAVLNRYRSFEAEVNRLGYRLLAEGAVDRAVTTFAINTRVYPRSANTWDSLGEALLAAGRRDEAIAAYRRAVALDPEFGSSVEALRRLGVQ